MNNNPPLVFLIPFRSGSKGLCDKNILDLAGLPLYLHTLKQALSFDDGLVYASTDYPLSKLPCFPDKVTYLKRRPELCSDDATMSDVVTDFIKTNKMLNTTIVLLQVTSPLRKIEDIDHAIKMFHETSFDLVMSVTKIGSSVLKTGFVGDQSEFIPLHDSKSCFSNRQELPDVYKPNGMIYIFDSSWFIENKGLSTSNIGALRIPCERSIDIDTMADLKLAENYLV
jgi:N-acylneuraminate cytidylyltransferase